MNLQSSANIGYIYTVSIISLFCYISIQPMTHIDSDIVLTVGTYTNDDIAAAWMLAFCTNTARLLTMYCLLNDVTSVLISGSFISHPTIRHCLEKCFMRNSLNLPFSGVSLLLIAFN